MLDTILITLALGAGLQPRPAAEPTPALHGAAHHARVDDDRGRGDDDDDDDDVDIEGRVEALDRANRTFRLRGLLVSYAGARFDDGSPRDLRNGARVEVEGRLIRGGRVLRAQEIEFDD